MKPFLLFIGIIIPFPLINKLGQPAVLGQLLAGIIISVLAHYNIGFFADMIHNTTISFLAEIGCIFLLFEIGLESSVLDIKHAGKYATQVALIGIILPFLLGFFILTPLILHSSNIGLAIFMGSMLSVTSTGISISVFKELGLIKNRACQIVLAASIIDDVIGLVLLSIVSGLFIAGGINFQHIMFTLSEVIAFFILSLAFGIFILPKLIDKVFYRINHTSLMAILILASLCFFESWFASRIGLASIIGAFTAGIILEDRFFKKYHLAGHTAINRLETKLVDLISPLGKILTPIFFIFAAMQVDIIAAFNINTILIALLISLFAILGKVLSGIFLPSGINKWLVGFGMVPRGEIGVIFAITGLQLKIIDNTLFTALLLMIIITSMIAPIAITIINRRKPT